jgi:hypothetical protein
MAKPQPGTGYAGKGRFTVFMKVNDPTEVVAKPAYSTLSATFDGTNATATFILDDLLDFAVGEYFTFSTPQGDFNISNGVVPLTGFTNIIIADGGATPFEMIKKIKVALANYEEIKFTDVSSTSFKLTAKTGGLCVAATVGTSALTFTGSATAGTGVWAEIGELAEDLDDGGELMTAKTASGKSFKTGETYNFKFGFINCNQRGKEAIESTFSGENVDLVLWDKTDFKSLVVGYRSLPCNTMFKPIGDMVRINFDLAIEYAAKQIGTTKYMWTFESETVGL